MREAIEFPHGECGAIYNGAAEGEKLKEDFQTCPGHPREAIMFPRDQIIDIHSR